MAEDVALILPDFIPTERTPQDGAAAHYPALERFMAVAQHARLHADWRAALAQRYGPADIAGLTPARLVARAFAGEPAGQAAGCWLLTPVHYFAGLDSVHLHPAGLLSLGADEQVMLADSFNRDFADGPWRIRATGEREMLLMGPQAGAAGEDPALWRGARLERGASAARAGEADLRRLGVELEMWLHEHSLNAARERAGQLRVIGLWPWGAQPLRGAQTRAGSATLWGRDAIAAALWRLSGAAHEPSVPETLDALDGEGSHVVLLPGIPGQAGVLDELERRWLAPALAALRSGSLRSIALMAGAHQFDLRRMRLVMRFWRSPVAWREALA